MAYKYFALFSVLLHVNLIPVEPFTPLLPVVSPEIFPANKEVSGFNVPSADLRLPVVLIPSHYKLQFRPILDEIPGENRFDAPGSVTITGKCVSATRNITLHIHDLRIHEADVKVRSKSTGAELGIIGHYYEPERDFYIIELSSDLTDGLEYEVQVPFTDYLSGDEWVGHYRAYYFDEEGRIHYMSTTKFEPYHARKAFPSFDEPQLKAVFEISLARMDKYHSLANTVIRESAPDPALPGWTWDHYEPTQVMSTYLVCMIVSDFQSTAADSGLYNKPVKVWGPPSNITKQGGKFPANTAATILNHYEELFGIEYAFPKMDSVSIPQFPSGAMENWGLNTYLEALLMYYPGISVEANRQQVASVLAHELTHQWFGNLVTCKWWHDIWLNEGFATYWHYFGQDAVIPEFEPHSRLYIDSIYGAMNFDEGPSTHPIHNSAEAPEEIASVFDVVTYHKGGAVLRMVEHIFGRPLFHQALRSYLAAMSYSNAEQDDLFSYLDTVKGVLPSDLTIKELLDNWTLQSGYPLVRVSRTSATTFLITQEKFGSARSSPQDDGSWHIPISIIFESDPDFSDKTPKYWLKAGQTNISIGMDGETDQWFIVNPEVAGFYRVLYDEELFTRIESQLLSDVNIIPLLTRSQLIDSYFKFAATGHSSIEQALRLTQYLNNEADLSPWTLVNNHLGTARTVFSGTLDGLAIMKTYLLPKINGALSLIGREQLRGDVGKNVITRAMLLDWACSFESSDCLDYGRRLFLEWRESSGDAPNPIPTDIQSVMYCAAVRNPSSGVQAFGFFYQKYKQTTERTLKTRLLSALACSKDERIIEILLADAIDPASSISDTDRVSLMQRVALNPAGRSMAMSFISRNFGVKLLTPGVYASVVSSIASYASLQGDIDQLEQDITSKGDALNPVKQQLVIAIESMKKNQVWLADRGQSMLNWFRAQTN